MSNPLQSVADTYVEMQTEGFTGGNNDPKKKAKPAGKTWVFHSQASHPELKAGKVHKRVLDVRDAPDEAAATKRAKAFYKKSNTKIHAMKLHRSYTPSTPEAKMKARARHWAKTGVSPGHIEHMRQQGWL